MKFIILASFFATQVLCHQEHFKTEIPIFRSVMYKMRDYLPDSKTSNQVKQGEIKEFFIQKEIDQQYGSFNITLNVDIVQVNAIRKPQYEDTYIPLSATGNPDQDKFQMNLELLQNSFRSGYYANTEKFATIEKFPYRDDNVAQLVKNIVFPQEFNGNEVDIRFHINKIGFNSKLNAKMAKEFNKQSFENALLDDHHFSQRQLALYLFDCEALKCSQQMINAIEQFNSKYPGIINTKITYGQDESIVAKVAGLVTSQVDGEQSSNEGLNKVADQRASEEKILLFSITVPQFLSFLRMDYFPKVTQFKFDSSVYQFESPLNFLMMKADFKEFVESFFQAEALLKYALQFYTDSLFTINIGEDRQDHIAKKQQTSQLMLKEFFTQMYRCVEILSDYNHLLQHDTPMKCGKDFSFGCFFRKYGASVLSLAILISGSYVIFKRKLEEVVERNERKNI